MAKENIERENLFGFLTDQLIRKPTGAYEKGFNKGIVVARAAVHNREITPSSDVIEVEKVEQVMKEILLRMNELMSEYMKHALGADYFAGKSEAMEIAIRLVRAALTDLLDETKKERRC